jgi:hypothetical protein
MSNQTTASERENLATHVDNCELRYRALDQRLEKVEEKLDSLETKINRFRLDFFKIMVGTAGSIITAIIGAVVAIKW